MSSKRVVDFGKLIEDESMGATITSAATGILHMDRAGYQLVWTGTPTGTFTIEISNDEVSWIDVPLDTAITAAGSADQAFIDLETAAKFTRVVYTRSSGTGTLNVHIVGKSISG